MTFTEEQAITQTEKQVFIKKILTGEKKRYQSKGYGLSFAILIAVSFFFGIPELARRYWHLVIEWEEKNQWGYLWIHLVTGVAMHNIVHLLGNLMYWFFYHNEFSFIGDSAMASWGDTSALLNENGTMTVPGGYKVGPDGRGGEQPRGSIIEGNICHEIGLWQKQSSLWFQVLRRVHPPSPDLYRQRVDA